MVTLIIGSLCSKPCGGELLFGGVRRSVKVIPEGGGIFLCILGRNHEGVGGLVSGGASPHIQTKRHIQTRGGTQARRGDERHHRRCSGRGDFHGRGWGFTVDGVVPDCAASGVLPRHRAVPVREPWLPRQPGPRQCSTDHYSRHQLLVL